MTRKMLILDDMDVRLDHLYDRYKHDYDVTCVKTAAEAIKHIKESEWTLLSLDHDLKDDHYDSFHKNGTYGSGTGMDVVDELVKMEGKQRPSFIIVHSWNEGRAREMVARLKDAYYNAAWIKFKRSY